MARRLKAGDEDGEITRTHNATEQKKIIAEAAANIIRLKGEKASIQEAITAERGKLKSLGIKSSDFNVALRYHELEAEDRNPALDNLRLCFEALGIGQQGSLFPESGADEEDEKPRRNNRAATALVAAAEHLNGG